MSYSAERPYLSLVITARNDDHGVNMLRRLQTFINALVGQSKRHAVPVELVLVEWNPPPEKPPLAQALRWPEDTGACSIRIVTVPPEVHRRYRLAGVLPLYQMIGKNVGIRRAEGEYILATNIDILLSDELMQFVGERRLEAGRMYRVDRHDVASDVPVDGGVEERLTYCRDNLLRVNAREGTFSLTPDGRRSPCTPDIVSPDSGIFFGAGWYLPEQHFGRLFRRASAEAELSVEPAVLSRALLVDLEPASGTTGASWPLTLFDSSGRALGEARISGRTILRIRIPPGAATLHLSAGDPDASGRTGVSFRAFRCAWDHAPAGEGPFVHAEPASRQPVARAKQIAIASARFLSGILRGEGSGRIGLPFSSRVLQRFRSEQGGASFALGEVSGPRLTTDLLHTNACGDFTLAHRRHWMELRGYPEFDLYSMNLDAVFCYMAHYGGAPERALSEPMRIYHIEHSEGSGWTPSGQKLLYRRLADNGIPWLPYEVVVQWASQMKSLGTTMVFNREDWGLGGLDLLETRPKAL